jgi:hypothetical protein
MYGPDVARFSIVGAAIAWEASAMAAMKEMPLTNILGSMYRIGKYVRFNEPELVLILL